METEKLLHESMLLHQGNEDNWFYLAIVVGVLFVAINYFNYLEALENKNYQKLKMETKIKQNELTKKKQKILEMSEEESEPV